MKQKHEPEQDLHGREVKRFLNQLRSLLFWQQSLFWMTCWCCVWGTLVLLSRFALKTSSVHAWLGLWGIIPVAWVAFTRARSLLPAAKEVRAFLDAHNQLGGFLVASSEVGLGGWSANVSNPAVPPLRWNAVSSLSACLAAILFVAAAIWLPQPYFSTGNTRRLALAEPVRELTKQIKILKKQDAITAKKAKLWKKRLKQIQERAKASDPARAWQALDHLRKKAREAARKAAQKKAAASEQVRKAAKMSQFLQRQQKQSKSVKSREEQRALAKAMKKMASHLKQASKLHSTLKKQKKLAKQLAALTKAAKSGKLSSKQRKQLQRLMKKLQGKLTSQMAALAKARLIDPKSIAAMSVKKNAKKTAAFCAGGGSGKKKGASGMLLGTGRRPGRGGITRGPGHVKISWKKKPPIHGVKFKAKALPASRILDLKKSRLLGISVGAPGKPKASAGSSGKGWAGKTIQENTGRRFQVLPQYRGTIRRFFQRKPK